MPTDLHALGNKAKIDRQDALDHPGRLMAKGMLQKAALSLQPAPTMEHRASFAVHMFQVGDGTDYAFVVQSVGLDQIPEGMTDVGLKELRRQLMAIYGREEKSLSKL